MSQLLARLVDDAGLFPPESLPMDEAVARHRADEAAGYPMLSHRFLCPASRIAELRTEWARLAGAGREPLRLGVILDTGLDGLDAARAEVAGDAALALEMLEVPAPSAGAVDAALDALAGFELAAFVEGPRTPDWVKAVARAAEGAAGLRGAKVRCGGARAELFPSPEELAAFVCACFEHGVPFKATAGLHGAVRHRDDQTGFVHHGFLNLVLAAARAAAGAPVDQVTAVLASTDGPTLADEARSVSGRELSAARLLFRAYGSCSTSEPREEAAALGLLARAVNVVDPWPPVPAGSLFGLTNLPFGVFSHPAAAGGARRVGVAVGESVLQVAPVLGDPVFASGTLDGFLAKGRPMWRETRARLTELLTDAHYRGAVVPHLVPRSEVTLHPPFTVRDYVDFYCSLDHATNVGRIFRPDADPLLPNWRHLPVGYHGRAGTVVVSGTPVVRPCGQRRPPGAEGPTFGPSGRLDIEAEVGFVVGIGSQLGEPVPIGDFADHVFGVVLVNDWSARDIQAWEYQPLGPFLGKSFATSISPWVVPLEALGAARVDGPVQDPAPLPYLERAEPWALDLELEVAINGSVVSRPPFATMYWTPDQMLAHLTVNGASTRTGDLYASGTVSGPEPGQRGSLIELSWNGAEPLTLADGSTRTFLEDGDTVTISATAPAADGVRLSLGEVTGTIHPARRH